MSHKFSKIVLNVSSAIHACYFDIVLGKLIQFLQDIMFKAYPERSMNPWKTDQKLIANSLSLL